MRTNLAQAAAVAAVSAVSLTATAQPAASHWGHTVAASPLVDAFLHPIFSLDHLLAMLAVGCWAAFAVPSLRKTALLPLAFVLALLAASLLSTASITPPLLEPMIQVSLLFIGLMLATRLNLPLWVGMTICAGFGLFHGFAHGTELLFGGLTSSNLLIIAAFTSATVLIQATGMALGIGLLSRHERLRTATGATIAILGTGMLAGI